MSTERDHNLPRLPRGRQSSSAADKRTVRRVGACIFADLLPKNMRDPMPMLSTPRSGSSLEDPERSPSREDRLPGDHAASILQTPASPAREETFTMRAYRTESRYYFSSKQL